MPWNVFSPLRAAAATLVVCLVAGTASAQIAPPLPDPSSPPVAGVEEEHRALDRGHPQRGIAGEVAVDLHCRIRVIQGHECALRVEAAPLDRDVKGHGNGRAPLRVRAERRVRRGKVCIEVHQRGELATPDDHDRVIHG